MANSLRRVRLVILGISLLLLLLLLAGAAVGSRVLADGRAQREAMDGSHSVVASLLELRSALFEMVVERNLILSRAPDAPQGGYAAARQRVLDRQAALQRLVADSPTQAWSAAELAEAAELFATRLDETVNRRLGEGLDLPMLLREAVAERNRLSSRIDAMITYERNELARFNEAYAGRMAQLRALFLALFVALVALALAAVWSFHRYLRGNAVRYHALEEAKQAADAANAALWESRGQLQSILDHARDPILLVDSSSRVQVANAAAARQFRQPLAEIIGSPVQALVPAYGARSGEVQARRADGSVFTADLSIGRYNESGNSASVCVLRDVTERRRLDELKSEFVSTVSHELRTPLTSIRASLGLVTGGVAGALPEEVRELLDIAHKNSERLVLLVNDILDIEKIEAGRLEFRRERVSARALLAQAQAANAAYAAQFEVRLEAAGDGTVDADVYADVARIQQVLANLLSNAAKFSPAGSVVELSLEVEAGDVTFRVRDHGPGIPQAFRGRIFQRFAQADSSDVRQKGGTGLGLSISRAIIEHHAGSMGFTDAEGGGTCFFFTLPRLVDRSTLPSPAPREARRPRVLIVEDEPAVAMLLQMLLDEHGWDGVIAHNAREAFERMDRETFDAMTLDLMLPDVDGISLFRRLRQRPDGKALPVVVISATAALGRQELNGDAVGVVDWLDKPISQGRLRDALRRALQGSEGPARILHVEDDQDITRVVSAVMGEEARLVPARNLAEARAALAGELRFALVIIDLGLPDGSGLDLIQDIRAMDRPPPVLVFSATDADHRTAREVAGTLVKSRTENGVLHDTIRHLMDAARPSRAEAADEARDGGEPRQSTETLA
ncbi:hybrid sensor histidine kinase/response regulator [Pseudoroseomonas rhizosphaerae]|uniref:histidine kinase n=1 Tax=Teichococcus rhizosphaerae TaxID=1335062 RepID=A0A2C7A6A6_9PROT|nr:response regulator [Pseudoroseomonas rhizosphaerae]PHK93143.1 hybrid sensor histidine kinase/response regulator [Pseudoroseomonas rhizosphaerae]